MLMMIILNIYSMDQVRLVFKGWLGGAIAPGGDIKIGAAKY